MFTKEYVREVLEQVCAPYMAVPLSDEYVQKIYDGFVEIRNSEAVEQSVQRMRCTCRRNFEGAIIKVDPNCPLVEAAHR